MYVMYAMLAYLMLFAALSNAACLCNDFFFQLIFANAFCFMLRLGLLTHSLFHFISLSYIVYIKYDFPSCAVLLISWFFLILCQHHFSHEAAMCCHEAAMCCHVLPCVAMKLPCAAMCCHVLSGEIAHKNNHYYYYY